MTKATDFGRSLAAVVASYFFTSFVGFFLNRIAFKFLVTQAENGQMPALSFSYMMVNLLISSLAAFAGGYLAGFAAGRAPLLHALLLAGVLLLLSIFTIYQFGQYMPKWYAVSISVLTFTSAVVGGWLRKVSEEKQRPAE